MGIYDCDPVTYYADELHDTVTTKDVLAKELKVMDAAAIALCKRQ